MDNIDEVIRDLTKVGSIPKSEARLRIQSLLTAQREEHLKILTEGKEVLMSGYCKCCGNKPCDHSTTGCPWKYSQHDNAIVIINEAINLIKKDE